MFEARRILEQVEDRRRMTESDAEDEGKSMLTAEALRAKQKAIKHILADSCKQDEPIRVRDAVAWIRGEAKNADLVAFLWYETLMEASVDDKVILLYILRMIMQPSPGRDAQQVADTFSVCIDSTFRHLCSVRDMQVLVALEDTLSVWSEPDDAGIYAIPEEIIEQLEGLLLKTRAALSGRVVYPLNPIARFANLKSSENPSPFTEKIVEFLSLYESTLSAPRIPNTVEQPLFGIMSCLVDAVRHNNRPIYRKCILDARETMRMHKPNLGDKLKPDNVHHVITITEQFNKDMHESCLELLHKARSFSDALKQRQQAAQQELMLHRRTHVMLQGLEDTLDNRTPVALTCRQAEAHGLLKKDAITRAFALSDMARPKHSRSCLPAAFLNTSSPDDARPNPLTHPHTFLKPAAFLNMTKETTNTPRKRPLSPTSRQNIAVTPNPRRPKTQTVLEDSVSLNHKLPTQSIASSDIFVNNCAGVVKDSKQGDRSQRGDLERRGTTLSSVALTFSTSASGNMFSGIVLDSNEAPRLYSQQRGATAAFVDMHSAEVHQQHESWPGPCRRVQRRAPAKFGSFGTTRFNEGDFRPTSNTFSRSVSGSLFTPGRCGSPSPTDGDNDDNDSDSSN